MTRRDEIGFLASHAYSLSAPTMALVDVCLLGGTHFTKRPVRFYLYDYIPRLRHLWPCSGPSWGGYEVHLLGEGFIRTNSITVRLLPLPTSDSEAPARRQKPSYDTDAALLAADDFEMAERLREQEHEKSVRAQEE